MLRRTVISAARMSTRWPRRGRTTPAHTDALAMDAPDQTTEGRWRPRPLLSFALRAMSVLVPAAAGAATAYGFVGIVPMPTGIALIPWGVGLVLLSTAATAIAEHLGKRFLPLAVLFRLSLVFPDRAPSRFAMARGAGNVRKLEMRIKDARDRGVDPEPVRAAEQILALVAALSAHDRKTRGHSERVRAFTDLVAGPAEALDAGSRSAPLGRAVARRRQDPRAGPDPQQARPSRREGMGAAPGTPRDRRSHRGAAAAVAGAVGPRDRAAPRAVRRRRVPARRWKGSRSRSRPGS